MVIKEHGLDQNKARTRQIFATYTMFIALAMLWILFSATTNGNFLLPRNISNIFRELPIIGVLVIGMTFCIITGNIDLSVGSVAGFSGAICALLLSQMHMSPIYCIILTLGVGIVIGLLQGFLVAYQRIPSFIVTLGGLMIFNGLMLILTNNTSIAVKDEFFNAISQAYLPKAIGYGIAAAGFFFFMINLIFKRKDRLVNNLQVEPMR